MSATKYDSKFSWGLGVGLGVGSAEDHRNYEWARGFYEMALEFSKTLPILDKQVCILLKMHKIQFQSVCNKSIFIHRLCARARITC